MRLVVIVGLFALTLMPIVTSAQTPAATPYPAPAEGIESSVARVFVAASDTSTDIVQVEVRIADFSSDTTASSAIALWFQQVQMDFGRYRYDLSGLRPVAIENIADETRALVTTAPQFEAPSETLEVTILAVRQNDVLFTFFLWSGYSNTLDEALDIARATLGLEPAAFPTVPAVPYETGGLWDIAPRIEDLPEGMTWEEDCVPCVGVLAAVTCDALATPTGE